MSKLHNLSAVIKFEILKQLRKPAFWIAIFAFPVLMAVLIGINYMSIQLAQQQKDHNQAELNQHLESLIFVDHSHLVDTKLFAKLKIEQLDNDQKALEHFQHSTNPKQALIIYHSNNSPVQISTYTKIQADQAQTQQLSSSVEELARSVLQASARAQVDQNLAQILGGQVLNVKRQIIDEHGETYNPFQKMILPGIFLAVFFLIFTLTGNQVLVATTEEKENRVAEMLLATIDAKALIIGKIIALVILGFIQIICLLTPILLLVLLGSQLGAIPANISSILSGISFDFWSLFFGVNLLIFGFLMSTGFTIMIGSLFPTAREASQFLAPIILASVVPFYFASAIFSGAKSIFIQILSFFPLSAPLTLLMRNTANNLPLLEGLIGLTIVILSSVAVMLLAVHTFRRGIFTYSKYASFKDVFKPVHKTSSRNTPTSC